jgi:hypothetical protein
MEMSEAVKRDIEFFRTVSSSSVNLDVPTGHAFLANILRAREHWALVCNVLDRKLVLATLLWCLRTLGVTCISYYSRAANTYS